MVSRYDDQLKRAFGARMRKLREDLGISQEALAHRCDLNRTYIGSVERGERNVSLVNINKIALALGVQPKDLV